MNRKTPDHFEVLYFARKVRRTVETASANYGLIMAGVFSLEQKPLVIKLLEEHSVQEVQGLSSWISAVEENNFLRKIDYASFLGQISFRVVSFPASISRSFAILRKS